MHLSTYSNLSAVRHLCFNEAPEVSVNAFSRDDIHALSCLLDEAESAFPQVRILILSAQARSPKGKPIFSAGANLKERQAWTDEEIIAHVDYERALTDRFRRSPLLTVCVVTGYAFGFGAELCACSDFVLATSEACFGFPEATHGIVPGAGGLKWALANTSRQALLHILKGDAFSVEEALTIGLVHEIVPTVDAAHDRIHALACALTRTSPESQRAIKLANDKAFQLRCPDGVERDAYMYALTQTRLASKNNTK